MTITSYRDLVVWQKGVALATEMFTVARAMPLRDHFAIGGQLQRAAVSIPANVAEGWARGTGRSYPFHVRIALGNEAELQTELEVAVRSRILQPETGRRLLIQTAEVGRLLNGLLGSLQSCER